MMKTSALLLSFTLSMLPAQAGIEQHFRKVENKVDGSQIRNIDFIYLINLDQRPEKLESCKKQLEPYGIYPHRVPGIYGWRLYGNVFEDVGLKFCPGMTRDLPVLTSHGLAYDCPTGNCEFALTYLNDSHFGRTIFSAWISSGGVGCTLSHLSLLQDAYDSGYQTIWVIEDDIAVSENPHALADVTDALDALVGADGWDLLFTDCYYTEGNENDLVIQYPWMWRPDIPLTASFLKSFDIGKDFKKIGSRNGTHSMIIRRSGIEKILNFYKAHHIFVPYDHELGLISELRLFASKRGVIRSKESPSDTKVWYY